MARVTVRQQGTRLEAARHCHLERSGDSVPDSPTAAVQGLRPVGRSDLALAWVPPHLPIRRQAARDGVSQDKAKNVGEMAGEARFSPEMAATRGLHGDPAEARRDSPDPGRRHDGRLHLAATVPRRPAAAAAVATQCTTLSRYSVRST